MFWKEISVDTHEITGKAVYCLHSALLLYYGFSSGRVTLVYHEAGPGVLGDFVTTTHYYCKIQLYNQ